MNIQQLFLPVLAISLSACAWVEPTKESLDVLLVKPGNVVDCDKLGTTYVTVTHKIGILTRDEEAVTDDLITVAKNKAAEMGGDSIVARGENEEGKMSFDVYECNLQ
jgi:hypothetical protein